eukprot:scaffold60122_cov53-Phaeocystis_antarctica.AAC.1
MSGKLSVQKRSKAYHLKVNSGPGPALARASQETTLGRTPHTQQLGQQVGWQPPAAMDATGLRATSSASTGWALRARAPAASLRTSHVPRATARRAAANWRAAARQVGGWRPSGKVREYGGGGAWRWRR